MKTLDLYNEEILELASLGYSTADFNVERGDYVMVEVVNKLTDAILRTFYSNRLLFSIPGGGYYTDDYHYQRSSGYMSGKEHSEEIHDVLLPIPVSDNNVVETNNPNTKLKKQFNIYTDKNNQLYVKPNEVLRLTNLDKGSYILRIHFLRDIRSDMSILFSTLKNNYIENGNFFGALEATQTGDLDASTGKNNFIMTYRNPGFSKTVLEQDGFGDNNYNMQVTGLEPNTTYVFSCWVAWDDKFDAGHGIVHFGEDFVDMRGYDCGGTKLDNGTRDLDSKEIGSLKWHRRFLKFFIPSNENFINKLDIMVGFNDGIKYKQATHSNGRRYFTDLRVEKLEVPVDEYLKPLMGDGYPVPPTPDNNDVYQRGSGSMEAGY
jgi:hypothetical protein